MADLIKKIKIKKQDGTFTDYIPIGADARNVIVSDGESIEVKLNKTPYYYNTVADMQADENLAAGDMAITLGYYESQDGGAAKYRITTNIQVEYDNGSKIELENGLTAELIIENNEVNLKQFGAKGDGETDDSVALQSALDNSNIVILNKNETYMLKKPVYLNSNNYINGNDCTITSNSDYEYYRVITTKNVDNDNYEHQNIQLNNINFNFDGVQLVPSGNVQPRGYISFKNVNNLVLKNIKIENNVSEIVSESQPIWLYNCSNVKVKKCTCNHIGRQYSGAGGVIWCYFSRLCRNYEIDNCNFYAYGDETIGFITLTGGDIKNIFIHNSEIKSSSRYTISLSNLSSTPNDYNKHNINIFSNIINGTINIDDYTEDINIENNKMELSKINNLYTATNLINFYNASNHIKNLSIINNIFINSYNDLTILVTGILISVNSKYTIIKQNKFLNFTDKAITNQDGTALVTNNYFENNNIDIYSTQTTKIINNTFNKTLKAGVNLLNTGILNTEISGNTFNECEKAILLKVTSSIYNRPLIINENKFYLDKNNIYLDDESTVNITPKTLIIGNKIIKGESTNGNLVTDNLGYLSNRMNLFNNYKYTQSSYVWSLLES